MTAENLKKLGLTEYEAKSYLALVKYGAMPGREVARKSAVPPTRVFDALKSLIDKGFVFLLSQKPMIFQAIKAELAVKGLVERQIENLEILEKSIEESVGKLQQPATEEKIEEKILVVSGFEKMFSIVTENTNNAKRIIGFFGRRKNPIFNRDCSSQGSKKGPDIQVHQFEMRQRKHTIFEKAEIHWCNDKVLQE